MCCWALVEWPAFRLIVSLVFSFFRRQEEAERKLVEEETVKRVEQAIQKKVDESLNSLEIRSELQRRLVEGRKRLQMEVAAQLEKEKEAALIEARQKEVISLNLKIQLCF